MSYAKCLLRVINPKPSKGKGDDAEYPIRQRSSHSTGDIPEGFDLISLPAAEYLAFQGEPFKEEDYSQAILSVQYAMDHYDPAVIGYEWDDSNPRIQLEPRGERGYIELRAIKRRNCV